MNNESKKTTENIDVCLLLDFYGLLLTEKTREILEFHYAEDMSLSEISDQYHITRQAVHDSIRRGVQTLQEYEEKLNLLHRFTMQKNCIREAICDIESGEIAAAKEKLTQLTQMI